MWHSLAKITGVSLLLIGFLTPHSASAQSESNLTQEQSENVSRLRAAGVYYRFIRNDESFSGYGPEFAFERSLGQRWNVGGSISQAYSLSDFATLFTSIDVSFYFSLWGKFAQDKRLWRDNGSIVAEYSKRRTGGLRLGLGTQQYFFNSSKGAIPFSGLAAKLVYEFGLNYDFDIALGMEASRLSNTSDRATALRAVVSLIWPLNS